MADETVKLVNGKITLVACKCQLKAWLAKAYGPDMAAQLREYIPADDTDLEAHMQFEEAWLIPKLSNRAAANKLLAMHERFRTARKLTPELVNMVQEHSALENHLIMTDAMLALAQEGYL